MAIAHPLLELINGEHLLPWKEETGILCSSIFEIPGDENFLINSSIVLFGAVESLRETLTAGVLCHLTCDTFNGEGDLTIVRSIAFSSGVHKVPDREMLTAGIPCCIPACDRLDGEWHFTKVRSIALSGGVEKVPEGVTLKAGVLSSIWKQ